MRDQKDDRMKDLCKMNKWGERSVALQQANQQAKQVSQLPN